MTFSNTGDVDLDETDLRILALVQEDCRTALARLGESVGLSAPAVLERMKKLEASGVITGYRAILDGGRLGLDITAFIGVIVDHPSHISVFEGQVSSLPDVLECHHVTGSHTFLLKIKTQNTSSLEGVISQIRRLEGVSRTETMVVLSTGVERVQLPLHPLEPPPAGNRRSRRNGTPALKGASR